MNDRFLEDLKSRIDIVEIVRKHAELKKVGKNFMCRSPFRSERTPSFCVSPDKQLWYDFGQSEGGDVISFVEKVENVSFAEAIEILSSSAGVEIPKNFGKSGSRSQTDKKNIYSLHERANDWFQEQLCKTPEAASYLASRNVENFCIQNWNIGYCGKLDDGLTKFLLNEGFSTKDIAESGVAYEREFGKKTMRDRFIERIIIPVREPREGHIIAFCGRDISGRKNTAKYINSPENPVYHKSSTLFGLYEARKAIQNQDAVILVEGNFDVIALHQAGFTHTVATCGTSLTDDHLRILKRFTKNIHLAFDTDLAGKKATLRAVEMILKMGLSAFVVDIPKGKDVDDLAQKDPEALKAAIKGAQRALPFLFEKFADKYLDGSLEGEKQFLDAFFFFVQLSGRPVEIDEYLSRIAKRLNRAKGIIEDEFQRYSQRTNTTKIKTPRQQEAVKFSREQCFAGFLAAFWHMLVDHVSEDTLEVLDEEGREIMSKKLVGTPLQEPEAQKLLSWQLHQENLYGESMDEDVVMRDFETFRKELGKKHVAQRRLEEAKKVRERLGY